MKSETESVNLEGANEEGKLLKFDTHMTYRMSKEPRRTASNLLNSMVIMMIPQLKHSIINNKRRLESTTVEIL